MCCSTRRSRRRKRSETGGPSSGRRSSSSGSAPIRSRKGRAGGTGAARGARDRGVAEALVPELERLEDDLGLAKALWLLSESHLIAGRWQERADALERAI